MVPMVHMMMNILTDDNLASCYNEPPMKCLGLQPRARDSFPRVTSHSSLLQVKTSLDTFGPVAHDGIMSAACAWMWLEVCLVKVEPQEWCQILATQAINSPQAFVFKRFLHCCHMLPTVHHSHSHHFAGSRLNRTDVESAQLEFP